MNPFETISRLMILIVYVTGVLNSIKHGKNFLLIKKDIVKFFFVIFKSYVL